MIAAAGRKGKGLWESELPRYFFDVVHLTDGSVAKDLEGMELPDLVGVRAEAEGAAREITAQAVLRGRLIDGDRIEVTDESGANVYVLLLRDVINLGEEPVADDPT